MLHNIKLLPAEIAANNAVPCGVVFLVELLLDEGRDVLLNVEFLQCSGGALHSILLHVLRHVSVLHDSFAFGHG